MVVCQTVVVPFCACSLSHSPATFAFSSSRLQSVSITTSACFILSSLDSWALILALASCSVRPVLSKSRLSTIASGATVTQISHSSTNEIYVGEDANGNTIWTRETAEVILYPVGDFTISKPHADMPEEIAKDYAEAWLVFSFSPKSSAALLRLVVQKLCKHLGEKGKNINDDVKSLVKNGLPSHIQKALDIVRVIGNEAVHPGEINIDDTPETSKKLFSLVNEIVEDQISKPKKQAEIENLYQTLPKNKLEGIQSRDKKNSSL